MRSSRLVQAYEAAADLLAGLLPSPQPRQKGHKVTDGFLRKLLSDSTPPSSSYAPKPQAPL